MNHTSTSLVVALLALVLLAVPTSSVRAMQRELDDRELLELFLAASALTHGERIDEAIDAWGDFVTTVDAWRAAGRPYGEPMEVHRFHANRSIALMLDAVTGRLKNELARLDRERAGRLVIAHLSRTEHYLRAYLDQFDWPPTDVPPRVADDPSHEMGAVYMLGALLLNRGRVHEDIGDLAAAESDWTAARDLLVDAIERMLGHPVQGPGEPGAPGLSEDLRFLTMMAERYLQSVALVDGPAAYARQAGQAIGWLPHDDHAVVIQMRSQAEEWARTGSNLDEASALCGLVREVHDDWFDGEFAHLVDNVWAHFVDIAIALDRGDLEKAEALLDALEAIPGLSAIDQARVAEIRRQVGSRLGSELSATRLLDEIYEFVDRELAERPTAPGSAESGSGGSAPPRKPSPPPAQSERPRAVPEPAPRASAAPAPPPSGPAGSRMSGITLILATVAAVVVTAAVLVLTAAGFRRFSRRE